MAVLGPGGPAKIIFMEGFDGAHNEGGQAAEQQQGTGAEFVHQPTHHWAAHTAFSPS